jgi:putative transposase
MEHVWIWIRTRFLLVWRWLLNTLTLTSMRRRQHRLYRVTQLPRFRMYPKPKWVRNEVIRLKALLPESGCRTIAHHFNRQWAAKRQMTVSKTYVADTCRKHRYLIYEARRKMKHRVPRPMRRNQVWGCDLLTKTDQHGTPHLAMAIIDHASRACLRLQSLTDKSSLTLLRELIKAVRHYGRPTFIRTDNEAVFVSRLFRCGLWLLGIHHQRTEPGCPWQNGRVERFIGTVKRELAREPITAGAQFGMALRDVRCWYNHDRPHDHLQGRTPAEVWAGIDVFAARAQVGRGSQNYAVQEDSG